MAAAMGTVARQAKRLPDAIATPRIETRVAPQANAAANTKNPTPKMSNQNR
jgi:hypothetical protein